ncbi:MAG: HAMP domain-containing protein [Candidatus Marinimicrobia bacterium]|nr:HAMP domain-containing protein [Candidatus Neomarinimicrobiota bacterium]
MKRYFNIKVKYTLFILLIHAVLLLISIPLLKTNTLYFLGIEMFILFSMVFSVYLYRSFIRPINLITEGIEAIKSNDFNTRFRKVGQWEMDTLIDVYNEMIDSLRLKQLNLERQNYFYEKLIETAPSGIIILDLNENVRIMNQAALKISGIKSFSNQKLSEFNNIFLQKLATLEPGIAQTIRLSGLLVYKCQRSHFYDRGFPRHFIIIEELSREILNSERKAYSKIIRMMSHEINNTVGAINSILDSVTKYLQKFNQPANQEYEKALQVALDRNNRLNHFMANFARVARLPKPVIKTFDLNEMLQSVRVLMAATTSKAIQWKFSSEYENFLIDADVEQMEQVLVNILKNSIEAIPQSGSIEVYTACSPKKQLIIQDDGIGIKEESRENLFSPFFSTKENGQGIGLTLVRDILLNHGFRFLLQTNEQHLTCFYIYF